MTTLPNDSPLSQVLPNSLDEIFNTPADEFTSPDDPRVMQISQAFRNDRARWIDNEKAKASKVTKTKADSNLTLKDLGL